LRPAEPDSIALPNPQEPVVEVIVDSAHRSPILEESEETNSDSSSKMEVESTALIVEPGGGEGDQKETGELIPRADASAEKETASDVPGQAGENPSVLADDLSKLSVNEEKVPSVNQGENK